MFMALLENRSSNFESIQQQKTEITTEITKCAKEVLRVLSKIPRLSPDKSYEKSVILLPRVQPHSMLTFNAKVADDKNSCSLNYGGFLPDDQNGVV
ncbi:hypothetical protein CHS0354_009530 [Potamilus streckersoni]|uniref:Uncharacterized protein n=1 Tax=Potamilus streckersoni TaxID=2493646 RepID=A0AAE0VZI1_9BIVA|nr:hypothetical protein CHS0354_009530 [Potamilus streckersoni]